MCENIAGTRQYTSAYYIGLRSSGNVEILIGCEYMLNTSYKNGSQILITATTATATNHIRVRKCSGNNWTTWKDLV